MMFLGQKAIVYIACAVSLKNRSYYKYLKLYQSHWARNCSNGVNFRKWYTVCLYHCACVSCHMMLLYHIYLLEIDNSYSGRTLSLEVTNIVMCPWLKLMLKVYMTDFFICPIKSPQRTDKNSKKTFDSDFPSPCFDVPKTWNFTSDGVQNPRDDKFAKKWYKSALFKKSKKTSEKLLFPRNFKSWNDISCFWSRGFIPYQK